MKKAKKKSKKTLEILPAAGKMDFIPREDLEELREKAKEKTPYERWVYWWQSGCDHPASPESWQGWDGGIDTACEFITNELCSTGLDLDTIYAIMRKTKTRLKDTP